MKDVRKQLSCEHKNDIIISRFYSMNTNFYEQNINSFWDACEVILMSFILKFQMK